jgi:GTPase
MDPPHVIQVRVAVIGNVDSGKSTMVGVLTRNMLDDGRGLARSKVSL